jgi:Ca2+/H+ antiporter
MKINNTVKGVIAAVLSCAVLEFGAIAVMTGFETDGIYFFWRVDSLNLYLLILAVIFIITALFGIAIARGNNLTKKIMLVLSISVFVIIICGYGYFVWHRFTAY